MPGQELSPDYVPEPDLSRRRQLPHNIDAEQSVLSACLISGDAVVEIVAQLVPESFYRANHRIIFASIMDLHKRNCPVDPISVMENLKAAGQLEVAGGETYLNDLGNYTYSLVNWKTHVEVVKRKWVLRDLIKAAGEITDLAYDAPDDLAVVVEEAEKTLFKVTERSVASEFQMMNDLVSDTFTDIMRIASEGGRINGIATGFIDIDDLFHGLRGGQLIILAARPGVGKTSFALNLATRAALLGATVAFLSLEMNGRELTQRILCCEARVSLSDLLAGRVQDDEWQALTGAGDRLSPLDFYIDDTASLSISELRAKARRELRDVEKNAMAKLDKMAKDNHWSEEAKEEYKSKHPNLGKGLIIVDYLQLMQPPRSRKDGNRAVEVAEISRGLKVLAKEMDMPVIALSQLSRSIESRTNKRPMLSDLRESGAIEQDADIVAFIDRSMNDMEAEEEDRPGKGEAQLIVAKHRSGQTRDIRLAFLERYTKFDNFIDDSRVGAYPVSGF